MSLLTFFSTSLLRKRLGMRPSKYKKSALNLGLTPLLSFLLKWHKCTSNTFKQWLVVQAGADYFQRTRMIGGISYNREHSGDSSSSLSASVAFPSVPNFLLAVDVSLELSWPPFASLEFRSWSRTEEWVGDTLHLWGSQKVRRLNEPTARIWSLLVFELVYQQQAPSLPHICWTTSPRHSSDLSACVFSIRQYTRACNAKGCPEAWDPRTGRHFVCRASLSSQVRNGTWAAATRSNFPKAFLLRFCFALSCPTGRFSRSVRVRSCETSIVKFQKL